MLYEVNNVEELYKRLNQGISYTNKRSIEMEWWRAKEEPHWNFAPGINLYVDDEGKYIHYQHYGSSAVKNNLKELKWVIENIFNDMKIEDFVAYEVGDIVETIKNYEKEK